MDNATFDALGDERRRTLLTTLSEESPLDATTSLTPNGDRTGSNTDQIEMVHCHLPKLVDEGFIHWNRDTNEIDRGPRFEELQPLLDVIAPLAER